MTQTEPQGSARATNSSQIVEVLQRFAAGWRSAEVSLLQGLWDHENTSNSYIASEREQALFGPPAIDHYYVETLAAFPITSMEIGNIHIDLLGEVAHAFCDITIGWKWKGEDRLSSPRATFVLRRRAGAWYLIHYHESIQWQLPQ